MNEDSYENVFKLLLIGDSGVGKSSIMMRFTDDTFSSDIGTTIGVDFKVKYINVNQNNKMKRIKLTIWDTAGQERFRTLTSSYYRGAQGVILVYDISKPESFSQLRQWLHEVETYSTYPQIVKLLVGNKLDLESERKVTKAEGQAFAKEQGMVFMECSAKTSQGIEKAFEEIAYQILNTKELLDNSKPKGVKVKSEDEENEEQEGFCANC